MQAFSNIRVIDLTHVIAGPFCSYQLAVMGAEVIKVEPAQNPDMLRARSNEFPAGEQGLGSFFASQNANKKALCLDLKSAQGQTIIKQLIATADVFIENYRTGAMAKLGLAFEDVKKIKADIVYCSMTGFGQQGPLSERTAYDNVIQAYSGLMAANGDEQTAPVKIGPPILDYGTGIQAAFAIAAALYQRTFTRQGQYIDIAMLDSALMLMSSNITQYNEFKELLPRSGNDSAFNAGYCCYQTLEGLLMLGAYTGEQVKNMWIVLGDPEHAEQMKNLRPPAMKDHLKTDQTRISKLLLNKSACEWEHLFNQQKVPAARVRSLDETLTDEQLNFRSVMQSPVNESENMRLPAASFMFADNGPKINHSAPILGQHTNEILKELGYSEVEISELESAGTIFKAD